MNDPTVERKPGRTPHGGVSSIAYFRDAKGNPCVKSRAVRVEIHELDSKGSILHRTHLAKDR